MQMRRRRLSGTRPGHREASGRDGTGEAGLVPAADQRITAQHSARAEAAVGHARRESEGQGVAPPVYAGAARPRLEAGYLAAEQRREIDIDTRAHSVAARRRVGESEAPLHFAEGSPLPS